MLHAEKDADHVDVEYAPKTLQRIFRDRLDIALDAGVVVERIDRAEPVDGGADIVRDLVLACNVRRDRERLGGGGQILDRGLEVVFPAVDGDDTGAAFGQQADGRGSDDAGRAGHDGNPAIEANSIGHAWGFLSLLRLSRILVVFAPGVGTSARTEATISSEAGHDQIMARRSKACFRLPGP